MERHRSGIDHGMGSNPTHFLVVSARLGNESMRGTPVIEG
jgi:hypothetical protein